MIEKLELPLLGLCPYQFINRPEALDQLELILVAKETVRATVGHAREAPAQEPSVARLSTTLSDGTWGRRGMRRLGQRVGLT